MVSRNLDVPRSAGNPAEAWGSDRIARLLAELGTEYICLNPGSSFRGLHDSLVNYLGNKKPQMLTCLHEEHAVAIAHGYAKVTGRPLAVALHANVGLMHATMAIFNAWCDRVPMMILGGTGPMDAAKRRPFIDWIHTMRDQGAIVRSYVKWDDQPASTEAAQEALLRGMQIACTAPAGPVYINLDQTVQESAFDPALAVPDLARFRSQQTPAPHHDTLQAALQALEIAERPVVLMGRVSRDVSAWAERIALAERLGARVVSDLKAGAAFPTTHPLHIGMPGMSLGKDTIVQIERADAILSLDWIDLAGALHAVWPDMNCPAQIIRVSADHHVHNGSSFDHMGLAPVDIDFATTPEAFIAAALDRLPGAKRVRQTDDEPTTSIALPSGAELGLPEIARALNDAVADTPTCLARVPLGWAGPLRHFEHPLDQIGHSGGGGVGSGPGMSVGAALGLRGSGRLAVAVLGDGDMLMGITAIWTAVHYDIPLLIVVANNRSYFNDEIHQERIARRRDRPVENRWIGQRIADPAPDIAKLAEAQGARGIGPIMDAVSLHTAVADAVRMVRDGKVVVVDVHIGPGYLGSAG